MRKLFALSLLCFSLCITHSAHALLNLELTRGVSGAVPIAIVPFAEQGETPSQNVSDIISSDLRMSGRFKVYGRNDMNTNYPSALPDVNFNYFRTLGTDDVVIGRVQQISANRYQVSFKLLDAYKGKENPQGSVLLNSTFVVSSNQLRPLAHHISDLIYQHITGVRGIFSTRLAYIVVKRQENAPTKYVLEVADVDGYSPQPLLTSFDPIMSPAWSPNGRQIAYVSFEKRHASIYVQDILSGNRRLLSEFEGINGAPAWSPDGKKLAIVLSKDGTPNIYIMDLSSHRLTQLTSDWSINTEPAWSPDGKNIIFTSNRGGEAQIYQKTIPGGAVSRVTYDGNYNARASFAHDGNHLIVLNRESSIYNIGILDLNTGNFRVLTNSGTDNDSPSIAPNNSMVLYGTYFNGRNVLGMVATDGSVQLRMPARDGDVQDPAWSPFLS